MADPFPAKQPARSRPFAPGGQLLGFAVSLALLGGIGIVSWLGLDRARSDVAWVDHTREILARAARVRLLLSRAENGRRGYIVTADPSERERYRQAIAGIPRELEPLRRLTRDNPDQQRRLSAIDGERSAWTSLLENANTAFEREGFSLSREAAVIQSTRARSNRLRALLDEIEGEENRLLDARERTAREHAERTRLAVLAGTAFGFLLLTAAAISAVRDSSARIRAENILRESEERYRQLVEGVGDYAIYMLDPEGRVRTWTESARQVKGYTAEEVVGKSHTIFYPPEAIAAGVPEELLASARLEGRAEDEGWRVRSDGSRFWADVLITAIRDRGELVGFAKVTRDVSERREAEKRIEALNQDLRHQAAALAASNEELQSFSYSVSHDLRAPLRSIDGFGEALVEDEGPRLSDTGRRHLERIRAAARRMGELIDALLELSRVARQSLRNERVDLSGIAEAIIGDLRRAHPERRVEVMIEPGMEAKGDERLIRLVLQNLLGNAWKFSSGREDAKVEFATERNGEVRYVVRDNGAGFDMRYADQLFLPFHRLHGVREFPGTGIGLATVARIVHRHGGDIRAEGRVGEGATFRFTL